MSDQSNQSSNIGSWDERGLLNSFKKKETNQQIQNIMLMLH